MLSTVYSHCHTTPALKSNECVTCSSYSTAQFCESVLLIKWLTVALTEAFAPPTPSTSKPASTEDVTLLENSAVLLQPQLTLLVKPCEIEIFCLEVLVWMWAHFPITFWQPPCCPSSPVPFLSLQVTIVALSLQVKSWQLQYMWSSCDH